MSRSWSDGRDVLYVNDALTGRELGRYDRQSGEFAVGDPIRVHAVARALWDFLDYGVVAARVVEEVWAAQAPAEAEAPEAPEAPEAHQDSEAAEVPEAVPAAELPPEPAPAAAPAAAPSLTPPAAPPAAPEAGHRAARVLDRALTKLRRDGWVVLSPGGKRVGADFDRLIIGPAGVFALTVKQAGPPIGSHERGHDADSATRILSDATGLAVKVRPVIVWVGAGIGRLDACAFTGHDGEPCDVLAARDENVVDMLWSLPAVYSAKERHQFLDVARHADFWRAA
ncbi:hypothetical protein [Actinospica robiniae]|uniref:hypothetical protein n=1 Tax=Actinospica robiniae TaxID=304901 RepID=UPI0003FC6204|nr:hypothetical protein [Actinospica robiniae]